jgi:hypothetical protein
MKTLKTVPLFLLLALLPACGMQLVEFASPEEGTPDAGISDAGNPDAGISDAGNPDAGISDAGNPDAGNPDAGNPDVTNPEAGNPDIGNPDAGDAGDAKLDAADGEAGPIDAADAGDARPEAGPPSCVCPPTGDAGDASTDDAGDAGDAGDASPEEGGVRCVCINLGLSAPFAIAATAGLTNTITEPITHINGNVVLDPNQTCNSVTVDNAGGFGLCNAMPPIITGTVITNTYPDTTTSTAIKADLSAAFLSITPLAGPPAVGRLGGGTNLASPSTLGNATGSALVLGDNWFTPGVYTSGTSILITGDILLDGQGDTNATFVFQSASTLTTADGAVSPGAHTRILLTGGAKASNVWWQVASSATIGTFSEVQGNILAAFSITMKTGATACGRSMAGAWVGGAGAFVFDSNVVSVPGNGCPL